MKKKRLALFLAAALAFTSVDSSMLMVSAADFTDSDLAVTETVDEIDASETADTETGTEETVVSDTCESAENPDGETAEEEIGTEPADADISIEDQTVDADEVAETAENAEIVEETTFSDSVADTSVEVTGVTILGADGRQETFVQGLDNPFNEFSMLSVNYSNGNSDNIVVQFSGDYQYSYGHSFRVKFFSEDGSEIEGAPSEAGIYTVKYYCDDELLEDLSWQLKIVEFKDVLKGELAVGGNPIKAGSDGYNWYSFTPEETGKYVIQNSSSVTLRTWDDTESTYSSVPMDYGSYELTAGNTYYVGFMGTRWDSDKYKNVYEYSINLIERPEVTRVTINDADNQKNIFVRGLDSLQPIYLNIEYSNGASGQAGPDYDGIYYNDGWGNKFTAKIFSGNGTEIDGTPSETGAYTIKYYCNDVLLENVSWQFEVVEVENAVKGKLTVGQNPIESASDGYYNWYSFTPSESGNYIFRNCGVSVRTLNQNSGEYETIEQIDDTYMGIYNLNKDKIYWVGFTGFQWDGAGDKIYNYTVTVERKLYPVSMEAVSPASVTAIADCVPADAGEVTVKITYDDGSTTFVRENGNVDEMPSDINESRIEGAFYRIDSDGNYELVRWPRYLSKDKTYVYRISIGADPDEPHYDNCYADIPVTVVPVSECPSTELSAEDTSVSNTGGYMTLKYTTTDAGRYEFRFNVPVSDARVLTETETQAEGVTSEDYTVYADLQASTTYYLYLSADSACETLKVSVNMITKPSSLKARTVKATYIAGLDYFNPQDFKSDVVVNGDTRTVLADEKAGGYYLQYRAEKDGQTEYGSFTPTTGNWTVTPYLTASPGVQSGSAVEVNMDIPVTPATFEAVLPAMDSLPALTAGQSVTVDSSAEKNLYKFTAPEDGKYVFDTDKGVDAKFYTVGSDSLDYVGSSFIMKSGETCVVNVVCSTGSGSFALCKTDAEVKVLNEDTAISLTDGMSLNIRQSDVNVTATFIPEEDGRYLLDCTSERSGDFYVKILPSKSEQDFGGWEYDSMYNNLEAGKVYTYTLCLGGAAEGSYLLSFNKVNSADVKKVKDIKPIAGVNEDGTAKDVSKFTVGEQIWQYYDALVTYTDGTEERKSLRDDDPGYYLILAANAKSGGDVVYKIRFSIGSIYTEPAEIPCRGLNSLEKLETAKTYICTAEGQPYCFTPDTDGEYIFVFGGDASFEIKGYNFLEDRADNLNSILTRSEGGNAWSVQLKAGMPYYVKVQPAEGTDTSTFMVKKAKILNGLKLLKAPDQTIIALENMDISLSGMQVEASYTDGTSEIVACGSADSSGRSVSISDRVWLSSGKCRVYVNLGRYQVSFELNAGSCLWETASRTEATCTENGKLVETCKVHGETRETVLPATGHSFGEWATVKEASCKDTGAETRTCEICKASETRTVRALGHNWGEDITVEAEETAAGRIYHVCSRCQEEETTKVLPASGVTRKIEEVQESIKDLEPESITEENPATDTQKSTVDDAVKSLTEIGSEKLLEGLDTEEAAGVMQTVAKTEELVVKTNDKLAETKVNTADIEGSVDIKGAALTAVTKIDETKEQELQAVFEVKKSSEDYSMALGENTYVFSATMNIVDIKNNEVVEEDVQPAAPLQVTVQIPEALQGTSFRLIHVHNGENEEITNFTISEDGKSLTFVITSLSDFVFAQAVCGEGEHTAGTWTETTASTCKIPGVKKTHCTVCGTEMQETLPLADHSFTLSTTDKKEATCTENGYQVEKCSNCDETKTVPITASGHSWGDPVIVTRATCVKNGAEKYVCTRCNTESSVITTDKDMDNHNWVTVTEKAADCENEGSGYQLCSDCGIKGSVVALPAAGAHTYAWKVTKEATCADGSRTQYCSVCGAQGNTETIKANADHKYGEWQVTAPATAVNAGTQQRICSVCGKTDTQTIEKLTPTLKLSVAERKTYPLKVKQTYTVKVTGLAAGDKVVSWKSNKPKIAAVNNSGKITAKKAGTATITVKLASGKTAWIKVKVQKPTVTTKSLSVKNASTQKAIKKNSTVALKKNKTLKLAVTLNPVTSLQKITYSSSNKSIAAISGKGVIKAKKKGTVTITVKSGSKSFKFKVKVK